MLTFSVITANYNSGEKLIDTAVTVLNQDIDLEYIIMDGGSSDGSIEIARQLAREYPEQVRLFCEPDAGIYDAMNKGISRAQGRYIFFLGAGDLLEPGILNKVRGLLPSHDRGFLYGDALWKGRRYDGPFTWRKLCKTNICHQAIFHGRDIFQIFGKYDIRYKVCADWQMNLQCFGSRLITKRHIPLLVAYFEEGGVTSNGDREFERDRFRVIRQSLGVLRYWQVKLPMLLDRLRSLLALAVDKIVASADESGEARR